jgi:hypothetical protein
MPPKIMLWYFRRLFPNGKKLVTVIFDAFLISGNLRYDISLVAQKLDELPEGLSILLDDASWVLVDSWTCVLSVKVTSE